MILPAFIPSWKFFDQVGEALLVEYAWTSATAEPQVWQNANRMSALSWSEMFLRLFWNPVGNEDLFIMSAADRFLRDSSESRLNIVRQRVAHRHPPENETDYLHLRIRMRELPLPESPLTPREPILACHAEPLRWNAFMPNPRERRS